MIGTFALSAVVGLAVGVISGLLGIGGGSMTVPIFRLAFGLSAVGSTATSLFTVIPTSISGAVTHIREKTCVPQLGLAMGVGGACTSPVGVLLAQISPSWAVMLGTAIAIAYSASTMLRKALKMSKSSGTAAGVRAVDAPAPALPPEPSASPLRKQVVGGVLIGMVVGVASGYVGLGGGFLMIPLMVSLLGMSMKQASGTSLVAIILIALPATVVQCLYGNVDYVVGIAVACGSVPGAHFGAKLVSRVPDRMLRFAFAGLLGVVSALLVVKEFGVL